MGNNIVVINRGQRVFKLQPLLVPDGKDKEGKDKFKTIPRELEPGGSIETLDADEAETLLGYREIVDAAKVVPANADKQREMQAEIDRLTAENAKLAAQEQAPEEAEVPRKKRGK